MTPERSSTSLAVKMDKVSKAFGGVKALDEVNLEIRSGEIHALLGGNGAGKSTILKVLRGVHTADSGVIEIEGKPVIQHSTEAAQKAGIGMIFQEMSLIPTLTVAQNIFLTNEYKDSLGLIDDKTAISKSRELFKDLGVNINPRAYVDELSAGQRQLTEIVKAISQDTRVLILDEPSTALTSDEVDRLFEFLHQIKERGTAVVYVSHRMDEIMRIADRATILRDGRNVITAPISELTIELIIEHIIGIKSGGLSDIERKPVSRGKLLLELKNASGKHRPKNINLAVHAGEVIGVAGLLGSGRSALARLLFGLDPLVSGSIFIAGKKVNLRKPKDAIDQGIALIPEDRLHQGVVIDHSVEENISLSVMDRLSKYGWVSMRRAVENANKQIFDLRIKTPSYRTIVRNLSGGNQQKIVLGKWLASEPRVLILDEPTAGIDIGSKSEIIALVRQLASDGCAVILISSELPELLAACDNIIVMKDGEIVRTIERHELDSPESNNSGASTDLQYAEKKFQQALQEAHQ